MRLLDWRTSQNVSRETLADRIGVSVEAIRLYETDQRTPRHKVMSAIMRETAGQVTANDFFQPAAE